VKAFILVGLDYIFIAFGPPARAPTTAPTPAPTLALASALAHAIAPATD